MCLAILTEASKVGAFESMYSVINQACPNILSDRTTVKTECLTILNEAPKLGANESGRNTANDHILEDKEQGAQKVKAHRVQKEANKQPTHHKTVKSEWEELANINDVSPECNTAGDTENRFSKKDSKSDYEHRHNDVTNDKVTDSQTRNQDYTSPREENSEKIKSARSNDILVANEHSVSPSKTTEIRSTTDSGHSSNRATRSKFTFWFDDNGFY